MMENAKATTRVYRDHIWYLLGLYWGNIRIMEKKMATTIVYRSIVYFGLQGLFC